MEVGTLAGRVLRARGGQRGIPRNTRSKRHRSVRAFAVSRMPSKNRASKSPGAKTATGFPLLRPQELLRESRKRFGAAKAGNRSHDGAGQRSPLVLL